MFSPAVGGRPSKIPSGSMGVHYSEDSRLQFFGYAVANISWSKPLQGESARLASRIDLS